MAAAFANLSAELVKGEPSDVQMDHLHTSHILLYCHHVTADSSPPNDQGLFLLASQREIPRVLGGNIHSLGTKTSKSAEPRTVGQEVETWSDVQWDLSFLHRVLQTQALYLLGAWHHVMTGEGVCTLSRRIAPHPHMVSTPA